MRKLNYNNITMQSYPSQSCVRVLVKPQENSFDIRKATNTGIVHDRRLAIYHQKLCPMVLERLFEDLQ